MNIKTLPLNVVILTSNEEANLEQALDSLAGRCREIFIVDSYSADRTVDIALRHESLGVRVVQHSFIDYSQQWNWALAHLPLSQPWVMKLDADERAPAAFWDELGTHLSLPRCDFEAFIIHWRLIFMGQWLRWGGLYPNGNIRIWRRGKARFGSRQVNEQPQVTGTVGEIRTPIEHHDRKSLTYWIDRHNRYSSLEAREASQGGLAIATPPKLTGRPDERRMWMRRLYNRFPARAFLYFCYRYFLRLGFLDGLGGFRFAFLHASFLYWIDLKHIESLATAAQPDVLWPARGSPHPTVAASDLQRLVDG
jgi:glycosyltransferase involved in cell wall biosynthesis